MNGLLHKLPGTVVQKNNSLVERNVIPDRSKWAQTEYILKSIVQTNEMQGLHSNTIKSTSKNTSEPLPNTIKRIPHHKFRKSLGPGIELRKE